MAGRYVFVDPEVVRLPILGGEHWVEIKRELGMGEQRELDTSGLDARLVGGQAETQFRFRAFSVAKLRIWLVAWSFTDRQDKPVPVTPDAIEKLSVEVADAINAAIDAHIESEKARKNALGPKPISATA